MKNSVTSEEIYLGLFICGSHATHGTVSLKM
jgi:hypothetical protein